MQSYGPQQNSAGGVHPDTAHSSWQMQPSPVQQLGSPLHAEIQSPHGSEVGGPQKLEAPHAPPPPSSPAQQPVTHCESAVHSMAQEVESPKFTQTWFTQQSELRTHAPPV